MVQISGDVTEADRANKQTWEDRATQPVVCTNASSYFVLKTTLNHKSISLFSQRKKFLSNLRDIFVSLCDGALG